MVDRTTDVSTRLSMLGAARWNQDWRTAGLAGSQALDQVARAADRPTRALQTVDAASVKAQQGLRAMGDTAAIITGPLGGVASRISGIVTLFGRVGPAGLGAAAVIGGLAIATTKAVGAAESFERQQLRTEAVLNATNFAAGRTEKQIDRLTFSIADMTLASREGAREAASALLTFRTISGDIFDRTLRVAQDLSDVFGQDLRSSAVQLGKALDDPVRGLTALRRIGVSFTEDQKEFVKQLVEANKQLEVQEFLLGEVAKQVGGAGGKAGQGLAGQFDGLIENVNRFWVNIDQNIGLLDRLTAGMAALAGLAREGADLQEFTPSGQLADLVGQIQDTRRSIEGPQPLDLFGREFGFGNASRRPEQVERLAEQTAEQRRLQAQIRRDSLASVRAGQTAARLRQIAIDDQEAAELKARGEKRLGFGVAPRAEIINQDGTREGARLRALQATAEGLEESFNGLTEEMGKQLIADEKRKNNLEALIDGAETQAELAGLTREEREEELAVLRAQKVAGGALAEADEARLRTAVATRQAQERASEEARRQAAETQRVWETAADGIQNALTEAFVSGPSGAIELLKRSAANLLSGALFRPAGLLGGLNPAASGGSAGGATFGGFNVGSLFSGGGQFSLGGGFSNLSSLGASAAGLFGFGAAGPGAVIAPNVGSIGASAAIPTGALSSGALGAIGGGLAFGAPVALSLLSGQGVPQALSGGLGSLAGLAIGGPIGAAVGGFAGNLLGGALFGGDKQKPRASGLVGFKDGGLAVLRAQRQDGGDEGTGRDLAQATVDAVQDFAKLAGAGFNTGFSGARGAGTLGLIQVKQTDDGPRFRFRRGLKPGGALGSFRTAEAAIDAFIGDAAAGGVLTGLPSAIRDVAGAEGGSEAARLLGVRRGVDDRIAALDGRGLVTALRTVGETFDGLTEDARKAGIDLAKIERLKQTEIIGIVTQASDDQIKAVGRLADASERRAFAAGQRARAAVGSAADLSRRFNATAALSSFDDVLRFGAGSPLLARDQLADARQRFQSLASRARGDDLAALEALPAAQATLLDLSERVNGRAGAFAVDFRDIRAINRELGVQSGDGSLRSVQERANTLLQEVANSVGAGGPNVAALNDVVARIKDLADGLNGTLAKEFRLLADEIRATVARL